MPIVVRPDGAHEMRLLPSMPMPAMPTRVECAAPERLHGSYGVRCAWSQLYWRSHFLRTVDADGAAEYTLWPGARCPACGSLVLALRFGG